MAVLVIAALASACGSSAGRAESEAEFADAAAEHCAAVLERGGTVDDCQESTTSEPTSISKNALVRWETDEGASVVACKGPEAIASPEPENVGTCLVPGKVLATGDEVVTAEAVREGDSWYVQVELTPAVNAKARAALGAPATRLARPFVNGRPLNTMTDMSSPDLLGDNFDEATAQQLADQLNA